ncbi:hypothetical protein VNO77_05217 [Canavalia gladiata]|uniref:Uncharacterized protein n=1 Tax=Canavalia gladiata TaxID=3824 RepID=A0AAN9N330_CANGL
MDSKLYSFYGVRRMHLGAMWVKRLVARECELWPCDHVRLWVESEPLDRQGSTVVHQLFEIDDTFASKPLHGIGKPYNPQSHKFSLFLEIIVDIERRNHHLHHL